MIGSAPPERHAPARGGRGAVRRRGGDARRAARGRGRRARPQRLGGRAARGREREARRPSRTTSPTTARRSTRCASTASSRRCSTATPIVIGDGGDFVSFAGRVIETYEPGCWMDPGPYGCLGAGPGLRARREARPPRPPGLPAARRRRVRLRGDGVRHVRAPRPAGRGRDGQQRHLGAREAPDGVPLRLLGGRRAAAGAAATTRSSRRSAGTASWSRGRTSCGRRSSGHSRAGKPALVNVLTDPDVVYPRKANLA